MKLLDFQLRSQVAKECINRVCEAAGLKSLKKRRCDKRIQQALAEKPDMENAGTNVTLRVSSKLLSLINLENNEIITSHDMPKISFASGGDSVSIAIVTHIDQSTFNHSNCIHCFSSWPTTIGNVGFCGVCCEKCRRLACLLRAGMWWRTSVRLNCGNWSSVRIAIQWILQQITVSFPEQ